MKKLKDLCLGVLINEGENVVSISPEDIDRVLDVNFDSDDIIIEFETSYGQKMNIIIKSDDFKKWLSKNNSAKNIFKKFIIDFLESSTEGGEDLNEIIDDSGEVIGDDDMPVNATNSLVTSPRFDLEKIYKSFVPKSIRFYSGDLGIGSIVW